MTYIMHISQYDTHIPKYQIRHKLIAQGNALEDELNNKLNDNTLTDEEFNYEI